MSHAVADQEPLYTPLQELLALQGPARRLHPAPGRKRARQAGQFLSVRKGRGMEFEESRPYVAGDDARCLDWKVTARTGSPHTKLFREERERPAFIAVDLRASMFFATRGRFKSAIACRTAAILAWQAQAQGDRIGGLILGDDEIDEIRPRGGRSSTLHLLSKLSELGQQPIRTQRSSNTLTHALDNLLRITHPGSRISLLSDFHDLDQQAEKRLLQLSRHNELTLVFVFDPLEQMLPDHGLMRVTDGQQTLTLNGDDARLRQRFSNSFAAHSQRLLSLCHSYRMSLWQCPTNQDPLRILQFGSSD